MYFYGDSFSNVKNLIPQYAQYIHKYVLIDTFYFVRKVKYLNQSIETTCNSTISCMYQNVFD